MCLHVNHVSLIPTWPSVQTDEINQSIAARISDQAAVEKQGNLVNVAPNPSETARDGCPHVEIRMTDGKDAPIKATSQSRAEDAVTNDEIVGECSSIDTAIRDMSEAAGGEKATCSNENGEQGSTNFMGNAQAAAQRVSTTSIARGNLHRGPS